jgi:LysR family transcriptional regulator, benzoate and cis,cis-muconate-responsive activator of ben and cat genes
MAPPLGVDLRLLESFVVLSDELHFTRAAKRLHVAQPALSQQIARLERQLGVMLFRRQPVELTSAGRALIERARPALRELRVAIEDARGEARTVRLGHLGSFGPRVIPALVAALGAAVKPRACTVEEQLRGLHEGTLDAGLFYLDREQVPDDPALILHPLATGAHHVALAASHRLAGMAAVPLDALAAERWILPHGGYQARLLAGICARHGFEPDVAAHTDSIETVLGMVGAGLGVAPVPWTVLPRPGRDVAFVTTPGETFDVVAATLVRGAASAVIDGLREVLSAAPRVR